VSTAGFPDSTVRESRDQVRAAIRNAGLAISVAPITVNLACRPAEGEDFASRGPGMSGRLKGEKKS
jgi:predicted ATPase with chaperone activity